MQQPQQERPVTTITGRTFENETVVLDFHEFQDCTLRNCTLLYHGLGAVDFNDSETENCHWRLGGPAGKTLNFLAFLYQSGAQELVEQIFQSIRQGQQSE